MGWDQHTQIRESSPQTLTLPSTGLQFCLEISRLLICLKNNEEFDKALKGVKANHCKNSKENVIAVDWSFEECF